MISDFMSSSNNSPMEWMLRSNTQGGIVFLRLKNNEIKRAYKMQDAGNQIIDGKLMSFYKTTSTQLI